MSLQAQQQALLAALLQAGPVPAGFDVERVRAAGRALLHKRRRQLLRAWPELASTEPALLARYLQQVALPSHGGALADGRRCVDWLRRRGWTVDGALLRRALDVDLRYRCTPDGMRARKGPCVRMLWSGRAGAVGVRWPGWREWHIVLPLPA